MVIDHYDIEQQRIAERYLAGDLDSGLHTAFSDHVVDCEECWDRLQLAQMWREHEHRRLTQKTTREPYAGYFPGVRFAEPATEPEVTFVETPFIDAPFLETGPAPAEVQFVECTALTVAPFRPWQVPTMITLAAMLVVALDYIHQQQLELARRAESPRMNRVAEFVMQFEPWHLVLLGALAALLLVLMPATYFLWELQKLTR